MEEIFICAVGEDGERLPQLIAPTALLKFTQSPSLPLGLHCACVGADGFTLVSIPVPFKLSFNSVRGKKEKMKKLIKTIAIITN